MTNLEKRLASKMLQLASDKFSNHGCNDLPEELMKDLKYKEEQELCKSIREWNGDLECDWPEYLFQVSDHQLMQYLSDKLK